jgi:DNA invertase Pin-like site-specific DNA recombinase
LPTWLFMSNRRNAMFTNNDQKITTDHLAKNAYLYIRQSTIRQVFENTESTKRQYALRDKAIALGWSIEQIIVIDSDLGKSGAESDRQGFQQLVTEVSLGHAGIVLGLEVSRLARNSMDWHRLLEICALTRSLILDEDGVYDPGHFNDRLLLGLKGTMSEAELHIIRARLQGGIENKARRGELQMRLPVGFIYDDNQVKLDPDQQVQNAIYLLFSTFKRTNSACATVRYFNNQGIKFPRRPHTGPNKGELLWGDLTHSRALQVVHNPRYSGAFAFGKTRTYRTINGTYNVKKIRPEDWRVLIHNAHISYISWQEYEANLKQLRENAYAYGYDRRKNPPREGVALLQGIVICGHCGLRMTVKYKSANGKQIPHYVCQREGIEHATTICQDIYGAAIDEVIGKLLK